MRSSLWPTLLPKNDLKNVLSNRNLCVRACVRACLRACVLASEQLCLSYHSSTFGSVGRFSRGLLQMMCLRQEDPPKRLKISARIQDVTSQSTGNSVVTALGTSGFMLWAVVAVCFIFQYSPIYGLKSPSFEYRGGKKFYLCQNVRTGYVPLPAFCSMGTGVIKQGNEAGTWRPLTSI